MNTWSKEKVFKLEGDIVSVTDIINHAVAMWRPVTDHTSLQVR